MMPLTLQNTWGTRVALSAIGASVCSVETADRNGRFSNIALAPLARGETPARYAYAGATLAPSAGRVPHGWLLLGGRRLALQPNEGAHHLHGGAEGLAACRWQLEGSTASSALFTCVAKAGLGGYPGNRRFGVAYALGDDNRLTIHLQATTDAPTWVNLSNHLYWNLSGDFTSTIGDHCLRIDASNAWWNDTQHIPAACKPVAGTVLDLTQPALLGPRLASGDAQLAIAHGYNNCYILQSPQAATLTHAPSGRALALQTDLPALVLYTGGFLPENLLLAGGGHARPACALALEPQLPPLTPCTRLAAFVTTAEQPFDHTISYRFSVMD